MPPTSRHYLIASPILLLSGFAVHHFRVSPPSEPSPEVLRDAPLQTVGPVAPKVSPSTLSIALICHREAPGAHTKSGAARCAPETDPTCYQIEEASLLAWAQQLSAAGVTFTILSEPTWYRAELAHHDTITAQIAALPTHPEIGCHAHHVDDYPGCYAALASLGVQASAVYGGATAGTQLASLWKPGAIIQGVSALPDHVSDGAPKNAGLYQPVSSEEWKVPAMSGSTNPLLLQGGTDSMAKAENLARIVAGGAPIVDAATGITVPFAYVDVMCDPAEITMPDGTQGDVGISAGDTAAKLLAHLSSAMSISNRVHVVTTTQAVDAWRRRGGLNEAFIPTLAIHGE